MGEPGAYLAAPGEPDDSISNGFVNPIDVLNLASPTAWVCKLIEELTGTDPVAWCTEFLAGEWEALWTFGDAMGNLARSMQELGIEIQQGAVALDQLWDGNASDAAYMYFSDLAAAVSSQQTPLLNSEESYHLAAKGAWQFATQLGNLIQAMADEAILAAIVAGGSTVAAGTGVGAPAAAAGYATSAIFVARILEEISQASRIINTAGTAVLGLFGLAIDASARVGHLSDHPLPASGFSLPAS